MRQSDAALREIALAMTPYFSPIVQAKGVLSNEDMRPALVKAFEDGVIKSRVQSDRSLAIIEREYVNQ